MTRNDFIVRIHEIHNLGSSGEPAQYEDLLNEFDRLLAASDMLAHEGARITAFENDVVALRLERDLVIEGSAEFEEECSTLRYRVKALERDASKVAREIGTMQEQKKKLATERDALVRLHGVAVETVDEFQKSNEEMRERFKTLAELLGDPFLIKFASLEELATHVKDERDELGGLDLTEKKELLDKIEQMENRLEEARELYRQLEDREGNLLGRLNLADAFAKKARAACAEISFEGTDGETRIAKTWLPVMEAERAYSENRQPMTYPADLDTLKAVFNLVRKASGCPEGEALDEHVSSLRSRLALADAVIEMVEEETCTCGKWDKENGGCKDGYPSACLSGENVCRALHAYREGKLPHVVNNPPLVGGLREAIDDRDAKLVQSYKRTIAAIRSFVKDEAMASGCYHLRAAWEMAKGSEQPEPRCPIAKFFTPFPYAKGGVFKGPTALAGEKAPCEVIPLPASMHSSARDDASIQDLMEAREEDRKVESLPCGSVPCVTVPPKKKWHPGKIASAEFVEDKGDCYPHMRCPDCEGNGGRHPEAMGVLQDPWIECQRCNGVGILVDEDKIVGVNMEKEPIQVKHADLERSGESMFRSFCPTCTVGHLLVGRDQDTFELLPEDNCSLCGQRFVYTDLGRLNERHGHTCPNCGRGFVRWSELRVGDNRVRCAYCNHVCKVRKGSDPDPEAEADARVEDGER